MGHYPNPFDFVPFPPAPFLRKEEEFDAMGDRISGYLELKIKALTPVHIVGKAEDGHSKMYRQDDKPCIPASSIRGCLRAFTEAVTAGWVSKWNPVYEKEFGDAPGKGRHIGFKAFEEYQPPGRDDYRTSPATVSPGFKPRLGVGKIDVASYLFGLVIEGKNEVKEDQARKSKVCIEDAYFSKKDVASADDLWMPDIEGTAFMGGAKPSASNWWYFLPAEIWERRPMNRRRNKPAGTVVEFVGEHFRGRKFYYHQDPVKCARLYDPVKGIWQYNDRKPFSRVKLESVLKDRVTEPFRIYLDNVPLALLKLLLSVLLLQPNATMRHKIGYAKAYGYGSIEFCLESAMLRRGKTGIPDALKLWNIVAESWSEDDVAKSGLTDLIDRKALTCLARILGWPHEGILFMYPPFKGKEFQQTIKKWEFEQMTTKTSLPMKVNFTEASDIARDLWGLKKPINFEVYQEKAENWDKIKRRTP
jgi:hypothetical protein